MLWSGYDTLLLQQVPVMQATSGLGRWKMLEAFTEAFARAWEAEARDLIESGRCGWLTTFSSFNDFSAKLTVSDIFYARFVFVPFHETGFSGGTAVVQTLVVFLRYTVCVVHGLRGLCLFFFCAVDPSKRHLTTSFPPSFLVVQRSSGRWRTRGTDAIR